MRLESVGKRYGLRQPWVVRDVSLEIAAGQLIRLEGRNGSGKSTLLRVAAGVSVPSAGRVTGRPHTGYVPERFPGGLAFSAREYLLHMGRLHGLRGPAVAAAAEEWLNRLGAADYAGSPLRTLSKGMCQKVAIAQALMSGPGLLILDEAWTGLDQAARATLDAAICERLADGSSVMFVDHQLSRLTGQLSQRWQFNGGRVKALAVAGDAGAGDGGAGEREHSGGRPAQPAGGPAASVLIEVSGLDADLVPQLSAVAGVKSAARVADSGRLQVSTTAAECDAVLRQLLGWDGAHVESVRPAAGAGGAAGTP